MSEKKCEKTKIDISQPVDISALQDLIIGPEWMQASSSKLRTLRKNGNRKNNSFKISKQIERKKKDRRISGSSGFIGFKRKDEKINIKNSSYLSSFSCEILFYPDDEVFRVLAQALKQSFKTYQLFEIAQLILDKKARYIVVLKTKLNSLNNSKKFFITIPDDIPFESEASAISHILKNHMDIFFNVQTIQVDACKGNFQMVSRCSITKEILAPPNYHKYQQILQAHHAMHLPTMSFEKFQSYIEFVRDPEVINQWIKKMMTVNRYTIKENIHKKESKMLYGIEEARSFLLENLRDKVIYETNTIRLTGEKISKIPKNSITRAIQNALEQQRSFPLDTANNLRGRLRRMGFNIYKKGGKGVSYVCAIKRKFRSEKNLFSNSIQNLIEFIEKNSEITISELPYKYLGIKISDSVKSEKNQINQLILDLRWLIAEGYVVEYANGILDVVPIAYNHSVKETKNKI